MPLNFWETSSDRQFGLHPQTGYEPAKISETALNFSRMRSKGSRFTLGVWGLRVCSFDVAFTFVTFGCFRRRVASFRMAGVALCDIPTCFMTCRKLLCVAGAILSRRFQKMRCSFHGRRCTLETSIVMSRGRRSTSGVSCCVFSANRIVRACDEN